MKTKTAQKTVEVIKSGDLAVWEDFDGRYSSTETVVRVVDYNPDSRQYLVRLKDKSWEIVSMRELRPA